MTRRFSKGGIARWSIYHPVSVIMLSLTVVVIGFISVQRLSIDLLPHIIYPEIRVRILNPGVPAEIMEDTVTRQLEEQLAITENAVKVYSNTAEGRSEVNLSFPYSMDIDLALRDASTRLDRARRFLPDTIDPPIIYKRDPMQIPVLELVVSSPTRNNIKLRDWVDYDFSKWFLNLPGVASTEVGGGNHREIQVVLNQERMAQLGYNFSDVKKLIDEENADVPGGRLLSPQGEFNTRTSGRFTSVEQLKNLPIPNKVENGKKGIVLGDIARIEDSAEDEQLYIRLNHVPGVKLTIQKQPSANTIDVVDLVKDRVEWLKQNNIVPSDVNIGIVSDQSTYVRYSLNNAVTAVISGALLAMTVVYLFLGRLQHTLIIGTAIPLAILVTFTFMAFKDLTLNIMTLGGFALGVGILIDSTIVMLENITRHKLKDNSPEAAVNAASEMNSPIIASTSTNLVAIIPFIFIGGLESLLFGELILTLSSAIIASLIVAITLVPALGAKIDPNKNPNKLTLTVDSYINKIRDRYAHILSRTIKHPFLYPVLLIPFLAISIFYISDAAERYSFLPRIDEGTVIIGLYSDSGTKLDQTDQALRKIENLLKDDENILSYFTLSGGRVFGRSEYYSSGSGSIRIELKRASERTMSSRKWLDNITKKIESLELPGFRIHTKIKAVRGLNAGGGGGNEDEVSLRIQGPHVETLRKLADRVTEILRPLDRVTIQNLRHTYESTNEELSINIDRQRAASLGISLDNISKALSVSLEGIVISKFMESDQEFDIRMRLPRSQVTNPSELNNIIVAIINNQSIRLRDVATISKTIAPATIKRDKQRRVAEISASIKGDISYTEVMSEINNKLADFKKNLPEGYTFYDAGDSELNNQSIRSGFILLFLAVFLIYTVMAIQYESYINPLVIIFSVAFGVIGVAFGLWVSDLPDGMPLTMPVILGLIMLAGIVVNNAIVLVEQIERQRDAGQSLHEAIIVAGQYRIRPILMTMLTTVFGMLPLALALGEGSEMLQPLAITIVWGLFFATLVSLLVVPCIYLLFHDKQPLQFFSRANNG